MKKGIDLNFSNLPQVKNIPLLIKAGFETCMPLLTGEYNDIEYMLSAIADSPLEIENAHLDFIGINDIWTNKGDERLEHLKKLVKLSAKYGVPTNIVHVSSTVSPPPVNAKGIKRFQELRQFALDNGTEISFENLRLMNYLEPVIDAIPDAKVCIDSGHMVCFTPAVNLWKSFSSKVNAVHIHDNDGVGDLHLIPFEGSINWELFLSDLARSSYQGNLTLECFMNNYTCSEEEFIFKASEAADRLIALYKNIKQTYNK